MCSASTASLKYQAVRVRVKEQNRVARRDVPHRAPIRSSTTWRGFADTFRSASWDDHADATTSTSAWTSMRVAVWVVSSGRCCACGLQAGRAAGSDRQPGAPPSRSIDIGGECNGGCAALSWLAIGRLSSGFAFGGCHITTNATGSPIARTFLAAV